MSTETQKKCTLIDHDDDDDDDDNPSDRQLIIFQTNGITVLLYTSCRVPSRC